MAPVYMTPISLPMLPNTGLFAKSVLALTIGVWLGQVLPEGFQNFLERQEATSLGPLVHSKRHNLDDTQARTHSEDVSSVLESTPQMSSCSTLVAETYKELTSQGGHSVMKRDKYVPLDCNQPQNGSEDIDDIWYFPPIRVRDSTPEHRYGRNGPQNASEGKLLDFPPIKARNKTPAPTIPAHSRSPRLGPRKNSLQPFSSSNEEPREARHRQQPNTGLGQTNIVNTVNAMVRHAKIENHLANPDCNYQGVRSHGAKSLLKRGSSIQDVADERPLKKQHVSSLDEDLIRWVEHEISGVKEGLEKIATEAREDRRSIHATLQDLLHEIRQRRAPWAYCIINVTTCIKKCQIYIIFVVISSYNLLFIFLCLIKLKA